MGMLPNSAVAADLALASLATTQLNASRTPVVGRAGPMPFEGPSPIAQGTNPERLVGGHRAKAYSRNSLVCQARDKMGRLRLLPVPNQRESLLRRAL